MARTNFFTITLNPDGTPLQGATITVLARSIATPFLIYTDSTTSAVLATPIITDQTGLTSLWLDDPQPYNITTSADGFQSYTQYFESISASTIQSILKRIGTLETTGGGGGGGGSGTQYWATPTGVSSSITNLFSTAVRVMSYLGVATPANAQATINLPVGGSINFGNAIQTLAFQGYATPVGLLFQGYATPIGSTSFQAYATPVEGIYWLQGGAGSVFSVPNAVGIGTSTPAGYLDVVGTSFQRNTTFETAPAGQPAVSVSGILLATPGIRFPDGSVQTSATAAGTKIFRTVHTWTIPGQIAAPVGGDVNYIVPFFVDTSTAETVQITDLRYVVHSGGTARLSVARNGISFTGMNNISVSTTAGLTTSATPVYNGDLLSLVVATPLNSATATPAGLTVTVALEHTV